MAYSDLLKDPRWQKKRLEVMARDNFTCQFCGAKDKTLAVHHLQYINGQNPWEYDNNILLTICQDCHQDEFETRKDAESDLLLFLSLCKFSRHDVYLLSEAFLRRSLMDNSKLLGHLHDIIINYDCIVFPEDIPTILSDASENNQLVGLSVINGDKNNE